MLFQWLWDLRHEYHGSLKINPARLEAQILVTVPPDRRTPWKPLDEAVALPLIRDALAWINAHGSFVLHVAEMLSRAIDSAVGLTRCQLHDRMGATYLELNTDPRMAEARAAMGNEAAHTFIVVRNLLTQTEGACLIVLLFLVGFRCSELVNLNADSIRPDVLEDGQPIYRLSGVAAKRGGLSRTWVASQPVVEVVEYMTLLYARARRLTGQRALFLCRAGGSLPRSTKTRRLSTVSVGKRIKMFADAPHRCSSPAVVRLHPHVARKTFARFVVLRDKRALEALSYHFGHTHMMITDGCYVGADIELAKLMNEEARKDLAHGLEDILRSGALAGKASRSLQTFMRDAQSGRYRGRRTLQSLVSKLINEGVQLAPCDWGYCVYSQSLSACRGTASGPNEENRSPEVCAMCANFVVTEKHRLWWSERQERDALFLSENGIPEQSRQWVSRRQAGTEKVLHELNERRRHGESPPAKKVKGIAER